MTENNPSANKTHVFISYAHEEKEFVRKFHDGLIKKEMDVWVDWQDIPPAADWRAEVKRAIEAADAFLFLLSPGSITSKVCGEELEWALKHNKKLIPVVIVPLPSGAPMDKRLRVPNWIYMRPTDTYDDAFRALLEAINTDLEWVRQHTRILQRALEWDAKKRNSSYLLYGSDIEESERWLGASAMTAALSVSPVQVEFIQASRKAAGQRQRNIIIGIGVALVVSIALGLVALGQRNLAIANEILAEQNAAFAQQQKEVAEQQRALALEQKGIAEEQRAVAERNEATAKAQRSVANAQIYQSRGGFLDISTLLAVDAWKRAEASKAAGVQSQAGNILRRNLSFLTAPLSQQKQAKSIWSIGASADRSVFVTSSEDGTACVWNADDGSKKYCVEHGDVVTIARFGLNDQFLFTGGENGKVNVWSADTGEPVRAFDYQSPVWDLAISPNNEWLAVGLDSGVVNIYILADLDRQPFRVTMSSSVYTTVFSPDSKWLGIGTAAGEVRYWNLQEQFYTVGPSHKNAILTISFSPNNQFALSSGADSTARLAQLVDGGQKFIMPHGDWVEDSAFSPDGKWFVTASDDNTVRVWDTATGKEIRRMAHADFAQAVNVSPDGRWIASTGKDKTVRVWEVATGAQALEIPLSARGWALDFSADGKILLTADDEGNVQRWDVSSLAARVGYLEFPEYVRLAIFSQDGNSLFVNTDDKKIWLVGAEKSQTDHAGASGKAVLSTPDLSYSMTISANAEWVAVAIPNNNEVILQSLTAPKEEPLVINSVGGLHEIAFSPDSLWLATTGDDGVTIWDVAALWNNVEPMQLFTLESDPVYSMTFSPDGKRLAVGGTDQTALWDLSTRKLIASPLPQGGNLISGRFSRDGAWLATGSASGSVYVWDVDSAEQGQPAFRFDVNGQAMSLAFSPSGDYLAVGSSDAFAYLFDLPRGEEVARLPHVDKVTSVDFSSDGKTLVTAARKVVEFWDVASIPFTRADDLISTACRRLTENLNNTIWAQLFLNESYQPICPDLPIGN
ncbi:MAG: TIR domain-containing protein [Chloroflexi bacterium]|nr:TIR domain-containing protein [Chloroflexota bacterium]